MKLQPSTDEVKRQTSDLCNQMGMHDYSLMAALNKDLFIIARDKSISLFRFSIRKPRFYIAMAFWTSLHSDLSGHYVRRHSENMIMATRLARFVCQGSGIALAAIVATSMSVHNNHVTADAQNGAAASTVGEVRSNTVDRHDEASRVTKVNYVRYGAKMYHHYP